MLSQTLNQMTAFYLDERLYSLNTFTVFCIGALNIEKIQQIVMNRSDFGCPLKRKKENFSSGRKN